MTFRLTPDQQTIRDRDPEAFAAGANAERERVHAHMELCRVTAQNPLNAVASGASVADRLPGYRQVAAERGNSTELSATLEKLGFEVEATGGTAPDEADAVVDRLIQRIGTAQAAQAVGVTLPSAESAEDFGDQVVARLAAHLPTSVPSAVTPPPASSASGGDLGDLVVERLAQQLPHRSGAQS